MQNIFFKDFSQTDLIYLRTASFFYQNSFDIYLSSIPGFLSAWVDPFIWTHVDVEDGQVELRLRVSSVRRQLVVAAGRHQVPGHQMALSVGVYILPIIDFFAHS